MDTKTSDFESLGPEIVPNFGYLSSGGATPNRLRVTTHPSIRGFS
jgi:hypothetical protein